VDRAAADIEEAVVVVLVTADGGRRAVGALTSTDARDRVARDAHLAGDTVEEVTKAKLAECVVSVGGILDAVAALKRAGGALTGIPGKDSGGKSKSSDDARVHGYRGVEWTCWRRGEQRPTFYKSAH